ncbi:hypothetical protein Tco_1463981 [Tanacetum coccineum]
MFTTIKVVSRHKDTQLYGAILPNELTNKDIRNSKSYKEYYVIASGAVPPKIKASVKKKQVGFDKAKTPPTAKGKRLKTSAKAAKPAKKKQPAKTSKDKGLTVLSEVALTEAEQIKLAIKRSLIQTHSSNASGSGADEGTGDIPGVPDVPTYRFDDEQISWKSSEEEDDNEVGMDDNDNDDNDEEDDDNDNDDQEYVEQDDEDQDDDDDEKTDPDNDGDDFIHPKFSTHDEEDIEEDSFDSWVQTPSHVESTDDEDNDEETQGANFEGDELNEEETNEEDEGDELYRDMNVNLEGRDIEMIDAQQTNIVEWHNYKHLDWITVRRDDGKLYKFKERDFKRLRIQDIKDMLLLLIQGKLTNLIVEERLAFNVSLRMFARSIVIQRRVEDLQLGVESYQKKLNLT